MELSRFRCELHIASIVNCSSLIICNLAELNSRASNWAYKRCSRLAAIHVIIIQLIVDRVHSQTGVMAH